MHASNTESEKERKRHIHRERERERVRDWGRKKENDKFKQIGKHTTVIITSVFNEYLI